MSATSARSPVVVCVFGGCSSPASSNKMYQNVPPKWPVVAADVRVHVSVAGGMMVATTRMTLSDGVLNALVNPAQHDDDTASSGWNSSLTCSKVVAVQILLSVESRVSKVSGKTEVPSSGNKRMVGLPVCQRNLSPSLFTILDVIWRPISPFRSFSGVQTTPREIACC